MNPIRRFFYRYPRLTASLFLVVGICSALHLYRAYHSGESFSSREPTMAVLGPLLGIAGLIEPRILNAWDRETISPMSWVYKGISILLCGIAVVLSLYLEHTVFKEWATRSLSDMGSTPR